MHDQSGGQCGRQIESKEDGGRELEIVQARSREDVGEDNS